MFELAVIQSFSAAHRLTGYRGECEKTHGHNFKVEAKVSVKTLNKIGLSIDFKTLKSILREIISKYDHEDLNALKEFSIAAPSSENIAKIIYARLQKKIEALGGKVSKVSVWESENASASYFE